MPPLRFDETLSRFELDAAMRQAKLILAAYSGGADSSCLLRLLRHWCGENGIPLAAAHVHHGIRGGEADRDEAFCRKNCGELGIPFYSTHCDVPRLAAESGRGLEEEARIARYRYFDRLAKELAGGIDGVLIATAHNADDNLETVLFHLLRGTGTRGLCGIDPLRDGRFLRPLIRDSGSTIRQWCAENGVEYVTDSTNGDGTAARNHLRLNVIPELRKLFPEPEAAVSRMTALLRQDDDYLTAEAQAILNGGLTRGALASLPFPIASRAIRLLYERVNPDHATLTEAHVRHILHLTAEHEGDGSLSLPGGVVFRTERQSVFLEVPEEERQMPADSVFSYPSDGNRYERNGACLLFSADEHPPFPEISDREENIYKLFISASLRFDKIKGGLQIRRRLPGDLYRFGGVTHKVKTLFGDRKMTASEKVNLPILADEDGIVWIPGFPLRDGMKWAGDGQPLFLLCRLSDRFPSFIAASQSAEPHN